MSCEAGVSKETETSRLYSGPPIFGQPHQRPPLLCGHNFEELTLYNWLYFPGGGDFYPDVCVEGLEKDPF